MAEKVVCPQCKAEASKVIYAGFSMRHCDGCGNLWGFWTWVAEIWFTGWLYPYEGGYLKAVWGWLWAGREG